MRLCAKNVEYINEILSFFAKEKENVDILVAWGGNVKYKSYKTKTTKRFKHCIMKVYEAIKSVYNINWMKSHIYSCYNGYGKVLTKDGHPRHLYSRCKKHRPSPDNAKFKHFDYEKYTKKFNAL